MGGGALATTSGKDVEVEFVGDEHTREKQQLGKLQRASLEACNVAFVSAGSLEIISQVQELDLRRNLLQSWTDVSRLQLSQPFVS